MLYLTFSLHLIFFCKFCHNSAMSWSSSWARRVFPQTLVLSRVTPRHFRSQTDPTGVGFPAVDLDLVSSNVYSLPERILLAWLSHVYQEHRQKLWTHKGGEEWWTFTTQLENCFILDDVVLDIYGVYSIEQSSQRPSSSSAIHEYFPNCLIIPLINLADAFL